MISRVSAKFDTIHPMETWWKEKKKLISDFERLQFLDQYATEALSSRGPDITELVNNLIKPAQNDFEKARLMFRWIGENIAYDVTLDQSQQSPEAVLRRGVAVCAGYSNLFKKFCSLANVQCEKICGISKGAHYHPGDKIDMTASRHAWNKIYLENQWYLCDATWAAGHEEKKNGGNTLSKRWDEWFIVNPEIFVNTHLPMKTGSVKPSTTSGNPLDFLNFILQSLEEVIDTEAQMVQNPYTDIDVWNNAIYKQPCALDHGIEAVVPLNAIIHSSDNTAEIILKCHNPIYFCISLVNRDANDSRSCNDHTIVYKVRDEVHILARLPQRGTYELEVCGDTHDDLNDDTLHAYLKYTIVGEGNQAHPPYCTNGHMLGLTPDAVATGADILGYDGGIIHALDGKAEVTFKFPSKTFPPVVALLRTKDEITDRFVDGKSDGELQVTFRIFCPHQDEFYFEIWFKNACEDVYKTNIQFLIVCDKGASTDECYTGGRQRAWDSTGRSIHVFHSFLIQRRVRTVRRVQKNVL